MINPILLKVLEQRNGFHVHAVEVSSVYELECIAEQLYQDFESEYSLKDILDFAGSLDVYALEVDPDTEEDIYNFSFYEYINDMLGVDISSVND